MVINKTWKIHACGKHVYPYLKNMAAGRNFRGCSDCLCWGQRAERGKFCFLHKREYQNQGSWVSACFRHQGTYFPRLQTSWDLEESLNDLITATWLILVHSRHNKQLLNKWKKGWMNGYRECTIYPDCMNMLINIFRPEEDFSGEAISQLFRDIDSTLSWWGAWNILRSWARWMTTRSNSQVRGVPT